MENIFTYVTKSIDLETSFLYDRREIVTAPMWSTDSSSLNTIFTSSNQHPHRKIYYMDVYSNSINTSSLHTEFSLAYGNYDGKGSTINPSGFITSSTGVSESRAVYSQFKNQLLSYDNIKYLEDGKFKFYGITSQIIGNYFWGKEYWLPFLSWQYPTKINISGILSNQLAAAKSISIGKSGKYDPNSSVIVIVTNSNELLASYPALSSLFNMKSTFKLSEDNDWASVSLGHGHLLALKNDGTLWVSGDNEFGQLGLGYTGGDGVQLTRMGNDSDWVFVCAGATYSFAIKNDGTLWSWGHNIQGQLGLGDLVNRNSPTEVTSYGTDNWTMIATSNAENYYEYQTIMGIQSDGTLWGWGDNNSGVIDLSNPDTTIPYQLGSDTDWEKISVGKAFAVGIKAGALKSWGSNDQNGTLGIGSNSPSSFPFNLGIQTPSSDTDWTDISCGPDYVLGVKNTLLYGWGNNDQFQLANTFNSQILSPTKLSSKIGWSILETAPYMAVGVIPNANQNPVKNIV
jgi:alpha-tubulin suppressor-like RCC1 family protein